MWALGLCSDFTTGSSKSWLNVSYPALGRTIGVGPHTISFPRMEPAVNTPMAENPPYKVSDYDFKRLIAIIRLSVPYTGMILTAREKPEIRREALEMGVSQIDAGSSIGIGFLFSKRP